MSGPNPPGPVPQAKALNCPNCGAALTVRSFNHAVTVVCESCHSILDAQDPKLKILQTFEVKYDDRPFIPLGTKGKIRGTVYEVIGYQRRTIQVEGIHYSWHEYLLFNPYKGFRYLTEYNGHWNDVSTLKSLPQLHKEGRKSLSYLGETYKHFQTAQAVTSYVVGEFPWQVRVGETAEVSDYVSPPRMISSERYGKEITWSMGEYMSGRDVWKAFSLSGDPPPAMGVYENQPSPLSASTTFIWTWCGIFVAALMLMMMVMSSMAKNEEVFTGSYRLDTTDPNGQASFVTDVFELKGHPSGVMINTVTNVHNNWIYLNYALINDATGEAYDFGREVSYYTGYDSDGSWTEGNWKDSATIPHVPPGRYYLLVAPESDRGRGVISYDIIVRRDVPVSSLYGLALLALLIPAGLITWRSINFEHMRWAESDYAS